MRQSATEIKKIQLEIDEEFKSDNEDGQTNSDAYSMALVPVDEKAMRKQRNERLKAKAKQIATGQDSSNGGKVLYDADAGDDAGTFVTGLGIPGTKKGKKKQEKALISREGEKFYASMEDELMDRVDQTEKDMKQMMSYLNSVEDMMAGDDLAQIRRMLDVTSDSVKHHSKAYTNIKDRVNEMNKDAGSALDSISKYNDDVKRMLQESEQASRKLATKVAILEEDSDDDDAGWSKSAKAGAQGISMANEKVLDVSLQKQKEDIVDKLFGMNTNIRNFANDVECKLQQAYKVGDYDKKFGFAGQTTQKTFEETTSVGSAGGKMTAFEKILHKDNNKLNRLQNQARNFISTGSYKGDVSKMTSNSRMSSANSQGALPDLTSSEIVRRHGPRSSRSGSGTLAAIEPTSAMRTSTGGMPGFAKNRI